MQLRIQNGAVDLSGEPILKQVDIEINTESKIGIVGRNGCGKTTLLRLISGELTLSNDNNGQKGSFTVSGKPVIGVMNQMTFRDNSITLLEEIRSAYSEILSMKSRLSELQSLMEKEQTEAVITEYTSLLERFTAIGGFYFEKEYEAAIKSFGFTEEEKHRPLSEFSGGQRTKIAFLKLLLSKPDLLLLDEPTNHLDIDAVLWLEDYIKDYKKAVVIVSHDRMFLDRTVSVIYEIEYGKTTRYIGNYTAFTEQKRILRQNQAKEYAAQQKETERLNDLIERFRYKATKAAMAQSKLKQLERMEPISSPDACDTRTFNASFEPENTSVKDVLTAKGLTIGFDKALATLDIDIKRGERIGVIGGNGIGKSTLLKTLVGKINPLSGSFTVGGGVKIGYFDQQMAQYSSPDTILDDFRKAYPRLTDFEARSALGAFRFSGEEVFKTVDMLSGGERVRLALCKLFKSRPNFLVLDEPTNHMDIIGKETLEDMLSGYSGTLLFVSHDRYFVKKTAERLLSFEKDGARWYDFGYEQYLEAQAALKAPVEKPQKETVKEKKNYTTPAKEKAKRERALKKNEELIASLEQKLEELNSQLNLQENISDYIKLSELQKEIEQTEIELDEAMTEWERLAELI